MQKAREATDKVSDSEIRRVIAESGGDVASADIVDGVRRAIMRRYIENGINDAHNATKGRDKYFCDWVDRFTKSHKRDGSSNAELTRLLSSMVRVPPFRVHVANCVTKSLDPHDVSGCIANGLARKLVPLVDHATRRTQKAIDSTQEFEIFLRDFTIDVENVENSGTGSKERATALKTFDKHFHGDAVYNARVSEVICLCLDGGTPTNDMATYSVDTQTAAKLMYRLMVIKTETCEKGDSERGPAMPRGWKPEEDSDGAKGFAEAISRLVL